MSPTSYETAPARIVMVSKQGWTVKTQLLGRLLINDRGPTDAGEGRELVRAGFPCGLNVLDRYAANRQRVRHQRPVAAPRHRFGAHNGGGSLPGELDQARNSGLEFRRLHVVRKAPETGVSPARIGRIRTRVAQAAELRQV